MKTKRTMNLGVLTNLTKKRAKEMLPKNCSDGPTAASTTIAQYISQSHSQIEHEQRLAIQPILLIKTADRFVPVSLRTVCVKNKKKS